jgi:hypothetical protein
MVQNPNPGRPTVSFEELAYSNMLVVQALVELLSEKGIVSTAQVTDRVKQLKQETKVSFPRPPEQERAAGSDPMATPVVVTAGDLVSANMVIVESLLALLVDKALLTQDELEQLLSELKQRSKQAIF